MVNPNNHKAHKIMNNTNTMEQQTEQILPAEVAQIAKGVSAEKVNEVHAVLTHVFTGVEQMKRQLESVVVADENDAINMKMANAIRLGVRQVRLNAEKTFDAKRAEVQAQMLSYKTEDQLWLKAKQTMQILTKEIEEMARYKEETKDRHLALEREKRIQQRATLVAQFAPTMTREEYEGLSDESFDMFLGVLEQRHKQKIEEERLAAEAREAQLKAEAEERERIRAENERLRKEAQEREEKARIEREAAAKALAEERIKNEEERIKAEQEQKRKNEEAAKIQRELDAEKARAEAEKMKFEQFQKEQAEKLEKVQQQLLKEQEEKDRLAQAKPTTSNAIDIAHTVVSSDWDLRKCFEQLRNDKSTHLGMGDIRRTAAVQEEICDLVDKFYTKVKAKVTTAELRDK